MRWTSSMGPKVPPAVNYSEWRSTTRPDRKRKNAAVEAEDLERKAKRSKQVHEQLLEEEVRAREVLERGRGLTRGLRPLGLIWDSVNYSCGYDAMFTVLGNLWAEDTARWSTCFGSFGPCLADFALAMNSHAPESARVLSDRPKFYVDRPHRKFTDAV
ncbi:hypothetical protein C8R47DRAFT_143660 [Mycena vitilis]|nr:hypothetical protein C8R47DRAFT_143660 [Mycena vitilis]